MAQVSKFACWAACSQADRLPALLQALHCAFDESELKITEAVAPLIYDDESGNMLIPKTAATVTDSLDYSGQIDSYFSALRTKHIGRNVLYFPVVSSTMNVVTKLQSRLSSSDYGSGFVCCANQQTAGRGRKGNDWTSPLGCAMFSVLLPIPLSSLLGKHLSFTQHLASIACVLAAQEGKTQQGLSFRLKWPNDIYFADSSDKPRLIKIGGIYVTSTIEHRNQTPTAWCNIGIGVNVSNSQPTMCINQIIKESRENRVNCNSDDNKHSGLFTVPTYIAAVMNKLESLLEQCQMFGVQSILPIYYRHWLHSGQQITIKLCKKPSIVNNEIDQVIDTFPGIIDGIDEYGMLKLKYGNDQKNGQQTAERHPEEQVREEIVQPDLATFDIFNAVIKVYR